MWRCRIGKRFFLGIVAAMVALAVGRGVAVRLGR